jgi:hypothetical protein
LNIPTYQLVHIIAGLTKELATSVNETELSSPVSEVVDPNYIVAKVS